MDVFLVELISVFVIAVLVGFVFRYFGLPSIIGHVLAGLFLGLSGFISLSSVDSLETLGTLGVTLLLFLVGLEMNWSEIKRVGREALFLFFGVTVILVLVYSAFGFFAIGFSPMVAVMFSVAMTFSSTIVVVKVLSEKKEINSYTGRLSLGILLLQDILAILLLVFLPSFKGAFDLSQLGFLIAKIVGLALIVNVAGHFVISLFMKYVLKTAEDLVLFSLAWFAVVIYFSVNILGLSPEIGGLLAGLSLSTSWGHFQIVSKVKVIRDVFLTMFFVLLGFQAGLGDVNLGLVLTLIPMIIVVKFFVTHSVARFVGLGGRPAIVLGINMTQVSEFGLVVMSSGLALGIWSDDIVKAVTLSGLISMALSTVMISKSEVLSRKISKLSRLLFSFGSKDKQLSVSKNGHVVLLGGDRTGMSILSSLKSMNESVVIVDFNPRVVADLKERGESVIFADATDPDVIELANITDSKLIISTMKNVDDSLCLLAELKNMGIDVPIIADAESLVQAKELYLAGASYVIFPHFVSGLHLGQVIKKYGKDKKSLFEYRQKQEIILSDIYEW